MRLVLNIGMHKTGTTAIQSNLAKFDRDGAAYLQIGHSNHSGVFATMFMPDPQLYPNHRKTGRTHDELKELKKTFFAKTDLFLSERLHDDCLLSSAEDLVIMPEEALVALRDWAAVRFDSIQLVGYARPPASMITSAMQQRIAGGVNWSFQSLYPNYREKFEKFDRVFGREKVSLKKFSRDDLYKGDVVADFLYQSGIEIDTDILQKSNESRSLEAISVLQAQRSFGRGWLKYVGSARHNNELVKALSHLGTTRIHIDPEILSEIIVENAEDLAWISERIGTEISDLPKKDGTRPAQSIRSKEGLEQLARNKLPGLLDLIREETGERDVDPQIIANAVDMLLDLIRTRPNPHKAK